jgi:hypothetical protein
LGCRRGGVLGWRRSGVLSWHRSGVLSWRRSGVLGWRWGWVLGWRWGGVLGWRRGGVLVLRGARAESGCEGGPSTHGVAVPVELATTVQEQNRGKEAGFGSSRELGRRENAVPARLNLYHPCRHSLHALLHG